MEFVKNTMIMVRGDSEAFDVKCTESDGTARPLVTGDKVYFTVKEDTEKTDKILQKVIDQFAGGVAMVFIDPEDTRLIKPGKYVYDVQISFAGGGIKTIVRPSTFILEGDVTYE